MYQNTNESSKWFYAFITDHTWSDEDTTTITIQTDVLQTYAFDYTVLTSFVEREHTADDTIGSNTYPENLECGEQNLNANLIRPLRKTGRCAKTPYAKSAPRCAFKKSPLIF